jgi:hypothetical protein
MQPHENERKKLTATFFDPFFTLLSHRPLHDAICCHRVNLPRPAAQPAASREDGARFG